MAGYLIKAIVGGILNYHAPFTRFRREDISAMDTKIRKVMRSKSGVANSTRLGILYDKNGLGLGWFSARTCINEVVLTEGWMALTSETLEGSMLREQMAWQNKEKGTVYSPHSVQSVQSTQSEKHWA